MTLDIGRAVEEGFSRLTARNGLLLFVVFLLVGVVSAVAQQSLSVAALEALVQTAESAGTGTEGAFTPEQLQQLRDQLQTQREASPLAVDVPAIVALSLVFTFALVAEAATMVAIRAFASDSADALPTDATDRLLSVTLNGFIGGIVLAVLVTIGLVLFILPGVFFYVVFVFLRQEIALRDRNFVDALAESYELTKENRLTLFGLVAILVVVSLVGLVPAFAATLVGVPSLVATGIGLFVGPVVALFGIAVTTRAYVQLRQSAGAKADQEEDEEPVGALGPDDIPEP
jgi:hypothetical protein